MSCGLRPPLRASLDGVVLGRVSRPLGILGGEHAQDDGVEPGALVGAALPQRTLVDEAQVLEHGPGGGVVLGHVHP